MTTSHAGATTRFSPANDYISSDFMDLASHMNDCHRSRGRFFNLRASLETLHAVLSRRIVTSGALLVICCALLLAVVA